MNKAAHLIIAVAFFGIPISAGATPPPSVKMYAISAPPPDYPYAARLKRLSGSGVVVMYIDTNTGHVTKAQMLKSTGHGILDNAALKAFRRWRFKPGTVSEVRNPITFSVVNDPNWSPNRLYTYWGTVKSVNIHGGTMTLRSRMSAEVVVAITPRTRLSKDGKAVTLREVAVGDKVRGQATFDPERKVVATSGEVNSVAR